MTRKQIHRLSSRNRSRMQRRRRLVCESLENRTLLAVAVGDILVADSGLPGVIQIDPTTGAQSTLSSGGNFVTPIGIAIDDITGDVFVADANAAGSGAVIRIDPNTGAQTVVASGGNLVDPHFVAIEADGSLVVADANAVGGPGAVIRVNRSTGAQTIVSFGGNFVDPAGIEVGPNGTLYVSDRNTGGAPPFNNTANAGGALIAVNPNTGAQTIINNNWGATGFFDPSGIEIEASGDVLVADLNSFDGGSDGQGGGVGAVFRVDPTLPPATNRTIVSDGSGSSPLDFESPSDVALEPNGNILMIDPNGPTAGDEKLFRIDPVTGAATILVQGGLFNNPNGIDVRQALDFGDAPDPAYPTLAGSNGARHVLGSGLFLGVGVDADADGQPDATATGDDVAGVPDDEDGVVLTSVNIPDSTATVTVTASAAGLLDAWVDFDYDGSWESGEQIFTSTALVAGPNSLSFSVPALATLGAQTFSRFRISTAGGLSPTGLALDGEVEDYALGSIHGQKFEDANANGLRDSSEPGLNGLIIDLYDSTGTTLLVSATTMDMELDGAPGIDPITERGVYWLPGLPPGDYIVRERSQNALLQTYPRALGATEYEVTLTEGQVLGAAPAETEIECGPGAHWVDNCGTPFIDSFFDVFYSVARVQVEGDVTSPLGAFNETFFSSGGTRITRSEPRESGTAGHLDTIDTEIVSLELTGSSPLLGSLRLRAGVDAGVAVPTQGLIQELGDPFLVDSFFDVFFEIDTPLGTLHNNVPIQLRADIEQVPPYLVGFASQNPVALFSAGDNPTGMFVTEVTHIPSFGVDFGNVAVDFGDAPDPTYPTLLASDGARHVITDGPILGAIVDAETDAQPTAAADGDDVLDASDDEDGVIAATSFVAGQAASFTIVASAPGLLDAWIDVDGNGVFDHTSEHLGGGVSIPVVSGPNVLNFTLPSSAVPGTSYARFRISSGGNLLPTGVAADGEVEDYQVEILTTGSIHGFKYEDVDANGAYNDVVDFPLGGVEFTLTGTNILGNAVNETGFTNVYGEFWFEELAPGNYTVTETVPAGFVATTAVSYSTALQSGEELVAFNGQAMIPAGDPQFEVLVGAPLMFGNTVPGSIHGLKFQDVDANGIYDDTIDLPMIGVDFTLTGIDGQGNVINTTETTGANGEFWFTGILASVNGVGPATGYTVTETVPAGFVATTPTSYSTDLLSRQELVALPGQAMLPPPISTTIDFDNVDASGGPITGAALESYLNQLGITVTDVTPSGLGEIVDDRVGFPSQVLRAFTDFNVFWHDSPNQSYSYTLNFAVPQTNFSFVRPELFGATPSGLIVAPWRARAFDASGALLDTVSEPQLAFFGNTPPVSFTLSGPAIASVIFDRTTLNTIAGLNRVPTDNWIVDVPSDPRREVVVGSDLMFGNQNVQESIIYVSSNTGGNVAGILFQDEDILAYDQSSDKWLLYFDGSQVGLTAKDVDAFHVQADGSILMSLDATTLGFAELGTVTDSDVIRFVPTALGINTAGTFEWYLDGSDVGLSPTAEDINAISLDSTGRLVISTINNYNVPAAAGTVTGTSRDLIVFNATTLGENSAGTWEKYFDGSDIGLGTNPENIYGASVDTLGPTPAIHLTTMGAFSVSSGTALSGDFNDVFTCDSSSLGETTACTSITQLIDMGTVGFGSENLDGIQVGKFTGTEVFGDKNIYVSSDYNGVVAGVPFADDDILVQDGSTGAWSLFLDGSSPGVGINGDIDAFHLDGGDIVMSFKAASVVPGLGAVRPEDIVRFTPTVPGDNSAGTFSWVLDGSDFDLSTSYENIDAIAVDPNTGDWVVSTTGNFNVPGLSGKDRDLIRFDGANWHPFLQGASVGLNYSAEDITGAWIDPITHNVHLNTLGTFNIPGLSGVRSDIFVPSLPARFFDGQANGLSTTAVDGIFVEYQNPPPLPSIQTAEPGTGEQAAPIATKVSPDAIRNDKVGSEPSTVKRSVRALVSSFRSAVAARNIHRSAVAALSTPQATADYYASLQEPIASDSLDDDLLDALVADIR